MRDTPVVYLQGPRQAGKSTLAQALRDDGYYADYFTLDDAVTLAAAQSDPDGFISGLPERVVLDEVQRVPELFRAIKRSVDVKRKPGRFLLTGSAQALVLPKVSESLAGRMEVLTLWPFSVKKTASPASGDFKGLRHLAEQTGKRFLRGILLYTGSTSVTFGPNLHAVPVSALWQLEAELTEP